MASINLRLKSSFLFPFLALIIPLIVRAIPEILMGPFVTGFDTIAYYIPNTMLWLTHGVASWSFIATAPFLYLPLMGLTSVGLQITITLKVLSPLLLGFLGLITYFYANKALLWQPKKSLFAALLATLYFVGLRISWDMLRSELGLIFLFAMLISLKRHSHNLKSKAVLSLAMVSVVLANQIVAIIMFAIIIATIVRCYLERNRSSLRTFILCSVPAVFLFILIVYANILIQFPLVVEFPAQDSGGFMALLGFASHADLVIDTLGFLAFCYLPLAPLLALGVKQFRSNLQLKAWVFWSFLPLFAIIVFPNVFFAVLPYRWTLLLTYPLAFCAAEGYERLKRNRWKAIAVLALATLSVGFLVLPNNSSFIYYDAFPTYVPKSMLQNTVPLYDCNSTTDALTWIRGNMEENAVLLTHRAFYSWALMLLNESRIVLYEYGNPENAAKMLSQDSFDQIYLIWWTNGQGWYGQSTVSSSFEELYRAERIAIYRYNGTDAT